MNAFRTLISALCILGGALLIVGWAVSSVAVKSVEDGSAISSIAEKAWAVPGVVTGISTQVQDQVLDTLSDRGFNAAALGVDDDIRSAVDSSVQSDLFQEALVAEVENAESEFLVALTAEDRPSAPFNVDVDVSSVINERIDDTEYLGDVAPDVAVPAASVEVMSAEAVDGARAGYASMVWLAAWGLWLGLGLLVLGILVSHRRRWFIAKALIAVGAVALAFGLIVRYVSPETILLFLPGGEGGVLGGMWQQTVTEDSADSIAQRSLLIGAGALVVSVVVMLVGRVFGGRR
ncbi:hypothetical protein [Demequina sediminicola]|uniref:hypothetical protein n=1 Tax=Demequina sediminicola TaxID=1095026 RepID=UPI000781FB98|nr:hypothetical protein [Demequina sediminicola]